MAVAPVSGDVNRPPPGAGAPSPTSADAPVQHQRGDVPSTFVVPLDGSDFSLRAVPVARRFATTFGAELRVITTPQTLETNERSAMPSWLETLVADPALPRITATMADGDDPALAVAELVAAIPDSAVCMTTHARGPIGSATLGNVAQRVLRQVAAPVLLVGRHSADNDRAHGPVLVAHDGSAAADAVLPAARGWAHACGLPVVLVYAYHPLDVPSAEHPLDAVRPALEFFGRGTTVEVVASSFPAGAIRDLARELDASVVALGTHGRTGAASVVMGSVANWVSRESPCPVLVARPKDLGSS